MMTSYTMTGDTREGRPVYYSNATCDFLYYKCGSILEWCVGPQVGGRWYQSIKVDDSHLYADEINGTFFLWDGRRRENTDAKIACSDDVPAGAVVPQPVSNTTDCTRVSLEGDATYQPSRMTTYTRTNQTRDGRPVYVSDRDSQDFLFFYDYYKQWRVWGNFYGYGYDLSVNDCAMTPDQTRPVWQLRDGSQWRFVPSVHATCVDAKPCSFLRCPSTSIHMSLPKDDNFILVDFSIYVIAVDAQLSVMTPIVDTTMSPNVTYPIMKYRVTPSNTLEAEQYLYPVVRFIACDNTCDVSVVIKDNTEPQILNCPKLSQNLYGEKCRDVNLYDYYSESRIASCFGDNVGIKDVICRQTHLDRIAIGESAHITCYTTDIAGTSSASYNITFYCKKNVCPPLKPPTYGAFVCHEDNLVQRCALFCKEGKFHKRRNIFECDMTNPSSTWTGAGVDDIICRIPVISAVAVVTVAVVAIAVVICFVTVYATEYFTDYECCVGWNRINDTCQEIPDIDECARGDSGCAQNCHNTHGSYFCTCDAWYSLAADEHNCTVGCPSGFYFDEQNNTCVDCPLGSYQDLQNQLYCKACPNGTWTEDIGSKNDTYCTDIDACKENPCDAQATCLDNPAPALDATCTCNAGYTGDGLVNGSGCSDINACSNNPCDAQATCVDNPAPALDANCTCHAGYIGDGLASGTGCLEIRPCSFACCPRPRIELTLPEHQNYVEVDFRVYIFAFDNTLNETTPLVDVTSEVTYPVTKYQVNPDRKPSSAGEYLFPPAKFKACSDTCEFSVIVKDKSAPQLLNCPSFEHHLQGDSCRDVNVSDYYSTSEMASWFRDNVGIKAVHCKQPTVNTIAPGETASVTCQAKDIVGNPSADCDITFYCQMQDCPPLKPPGFGAFVCHENQQEHRCALICTEGKFHTRRIEDIFRCDPNSPSPRWTGVNVDHVSCRGFATIAPALLRGPDGAVCTRQASRTVMYTIENRRKREPSSGLWDYLRMLDVFGIKKASVFIVCTGADVDECWYLSDSCDREDEYCINTEGSYKCCSNDGLHPINGIVCHEARSCSFVSCPSTSIHMSLPKDENYILVDFSNYVKAVDAQLSEMTPIVDNIMSPNVTYPIMKYEVSPSKTLEAGLYLYHVTRFIACNDTCDVSVLIKDNTEPHILNCPDLSQNLYGEECRDVNLYDYYSKSRISSCFGDNVGIKDVICRQTHLDRIAIGETAHITCYATDIAGTSSASYNITFHCKKNVCPPLKPPTHGAFVCHEDNLVQRCILFCREDKVHKRRNIFECDMTNPSSTWTGAGVDDIICQNRPHESTFPVVPFVSAAAGVTVAVVAIAVIIQPFVTWRTGRNNSTPGNRTFPPSVSPVPGDHAGSVESRLLRDEIRTLKRAVPRNLPCKLGESGGQVAHQNTVSSGLFDPLQPFHLHNCDYAV
uniref:EGF-like domain-containing protein n=1 Tax=Branchiostoma floridae TaxID=7739 RepID=C3XS86_BRAFL|eukprot:XP_002613092.1 hypothetical protein BRAFLDRAFT_89974 [Branchiostoma floridae]